MDSDREALLEVLLRHDVAFVVIGGAAIQSHGGDLRHLDIDVMPDIEPDNLALSDVASGRQTRVAAAPSIRLIRMGTTSVRGRRPGRVHRWLPASYMSAYADRNPGMGTAGRGSLV